MKKLLAATAMVIALGTTPVMAEHSFDHRPSREEIKAMSPEQKKAFFEERKAKWAKLSKEEKLEVIEKRRTERLKKMDEKWTSMNDDEKIKFVEERFEKRGKRYGKGHD